MMKNPRTFSMLSFSLYGLGFFLFLEWLYPLKVFDQMTAINIFIIYASFCFLISLLNVSWWVSFLLKGASLLLIINQLYFASPLLSRAWLQELALEIEQNILMIMNHQWFHLTDSFRTFLCLLLIWLMSYLIYYWFVTMKQILVFIVLTFIYLALLDTFTLYDGSLAMIRLFIIAFIALGLTHMYKVVTEASLPSLPNNKLWRWIISLISIVLFSASVGYLAPKYAPKWPDPLPLITSYTSENGFSINRTRKVGYSEDDSRLGGSFNLDHTPVFHVTAPNRQYWRVETKDFYSGKGWHTSTDPDYRLADGMVFYQMFLWNVETEQQEAFVEFQGNVNISKLVYPYGLQHVEANEPLNIEIDYLTGAIVKQSGDHFATDALTLTYEYPMYDINMLRRDAQSHEYPEMIEHYTQVPTNLPDRVHELARQITESASTRYDKAIAIEQYFHQHGFQYETSNIPYPDEEQDYVDQFLFDLKRGYCDHFSTSMVVMLRTLDIPARWVKGFTGGQPVDHPSGQLPHGYQYYEITNANAHSWVEVFFPDVGWVPFEPTQGFSNPVTFYDTLEELEEIEEVAQPDIEEATELDEQDETLPDQVEMDITPANEQDEETKAIPYWIYIVISIGILSGVVVAYRMRYRLRTWYIFNQLQMSADFKRFEQAYHHLLSLLSHKGLKKAPDQTLREYAVLVDEAYGMNDMQNMTKDYEQMLYNNKTSKQMTKEQINLWRQIINRIEGK